MKIICNRLNMDSWWNLKGVQGYRNLHSIGENTHHYKILYMKGFVAIMLESRIYKLWDFVRIHSPPLQFLCYSV